METTEILKNKFELLIIGKMLSPEEALINLGYKLGSDYDNLCLSIKILNDGWYPNWENENENKYWIWWTMKGGFSCDTVNYDNTDTSVPSALCLKTRELAEHASKIAYKEYKEYYS